MRVIGGTHRGRRIEPPAGLPFRPTTDRAREALFNILAHRYPLEDATVLDGFAGSGAVAAECISRGATEVVAVDQHPKVARWLRDLATGFPLPQLQVMQADIFRYLQQPPRPFDLLFFDPPYALPNKLELVTRALKGWVAPQGVIVLEHPASESYTHVPGCVDTRAYSLVAFSFFEPTS